MKVRVLVEQPEYRGEPPRAGLASGQVYDLDNARAKSLLETGAAEPVAEKVEAAAEKRPGETDLETRQRVEVSPDDNAPNPAGIEEVAVDENGDPLPGQRTNENVGKESGKPVEAAAEGVPADLPDDGHPSIGGNSPVEQDAPIGGRTDDASESGGESPPPARKKRARRK